MDTKPLLLLYPREWTVSLVETRACAMSRRSSLPRGSKRPREASPSSPSGGTQPVATQVVATQPVATQRLRSGAPAEEEGGEDAALPLAGGAGGSAFGDFDEYEEDEGEGEEEAAGGAGGDDEADAAGADVSPSASELPLPADDDDGDDDARVSGGGSESGEGDSAMGWEPDDAPPASHFEAAQRLINLRCRGLAAAPLPPGLAASLSCVRCHRLLSHRTSPAARRRAYRARELQALFAEVVAGEAASQSVFVLGNQGTGKTLVVERAVASLLEQHGDALVVVRLDGRTDWEEKDAVRKMCAQLAAQEGAAAASAAAEAAATGGACSQPRRCVGACAAPPKSVTDATGAFHAHLARLRTSGVVAFFILDHLDLFAPQGSSQLVLYNLMDGLQSAGVRAVVAGVSSHSDILSLLEKRVKSRFSNRTIKLAPVGGHGAVASLLLLPESESDADWGCAAPPLPPAPAGSHARHRGGGGRRAYAAAWNEAVRSAMGAPAVASALDALSAADNTPATAAHVASLVVCAASARGACAWRAAAEATHTSGGSPRDAATAKPSSPPQPPSAADFAKVLSRLMDDPVRCDLGEHAPRDALLLLVASKRMASMRDCPAPTFAAVYAEYSSLCASSGSVVGSAPLPPPDAWALFARLVATGHMQRALPGSMAGRGASFAGKRARGGVVTRSCAGGGAGGGGGGGSGAGAAAAHAGAAGAGGGGLRDMTPWRCCVPDCEAAAAIRAHPHAPNELATLLTHEAVGGGAGAVLGA